MAEIKPEIVERAARAACLAAGKDPDRLTPAPRGTVGERAVWQLWAPAAQNALSAVADELRAEGDSAGYERGVREAAEVASAFIPDESSAYTAVRATVARAVHRAILALLEPPAEVPDPPPERSLVEDDPARRWLRGEDASAPLSRAKLEMLYRGAERLSWVDAALAKQAGWLADQMQRLLDNPPDALARAREAGRG